METIGGSREFLRTLDVTKFEFIKGSRDAIAVGRVTRHDNGAVHQFMPRNAALTMDYPVSVARIHYKRPQDRR